MTVLAPPKAPSPPASDPLAGGVPAVDLAEYLDQLVRESDNDDRRVDWREQADRGLSLYLGEHFETGDDGTMKRVVLNRTQNVIVSLVAIQAGDKPAITFTPRETGEPPLYYLNTQLPESQQIAAQFGAGAIDPMTGLPSPGIDFEQPLPPEVSIQIKQLVETNRLVAMQAAVEGQPAPPLLPDNLLVEVTDATTSRAVQTIFDGMWEASDAACIFSENILCKNVFGWQPTLFEFDDERKIPVLTNVNPKHVFPDPLNGDSRRWHYVVYDQPISADEAKQKWPHLSQKIDDEADTGSITWPGQRSYQTSSVYDQRFERRMIVMRTGWLRYQRYPMSPDEALRAGLVVEVSGDFGPQDRSMVDDGIGDGSVLRADDGSGVGGNEGNLESQGGSVPTDQATVRPLSVGLSFILPDGTPVAPGEPNWPTRQGIRQITVVANEVVDDRECEHADIPLPTNRNVPIPFSPYGQGEPKRLENLQTAVNRLVTCAVTQQAYNAFPVEIMPESVVDAMPKELRDARIKPNKRITVPDALITQLGDKDKILGYLESPSLDAGFWQLLGFLVEMIDKEGNQADVIQGNAPSRASGEYVANLQSAASQIIRGKSMYTEYWLRSLVRLFVHAIVTRLTPDDWRRYLSKYPYQAISAMHSRAKSMDVDISVEIGSASGASKASQTQNLVAARQMGVPVSDATLLERLGVDPDAEAAKQADAARKTASMQGVANMTGMESGGGSNKPPGGSKDKSAQQAA